MKREFLQNFRVGEEALPKDMIDAIMAENGRDIQAAKEAAAKPYADYDALRAENERLKAETTAGGKTAAQWQAEFDRAAAEHEAAIEGIRFRNELDSAITAAGGRNAKAISALLELDTLKASEDRKAAIDTALKALQKTDGYLFGAVTPPPYAGGTGTLQRENLQMPADLAGALREKFERK